MSKAPRTLPRPRKAKHGPPLKQEGRGRPDRSSVRKSTGRDDRTGRLWKQQRGKAAISSKCGRAGRVVFLLMNNQFRRDFACDTPSEQPCKGYDLEGDPSSNTDKRGFEYGALPVAIAIVFFHKTHVLIG